MTETVDVRTKGWNNPDCCYRVMVNDSYEDWDGNVVDDWKWENRKYCQITTVNVKTDYCKHCNKNLRYP